MEKGERDPVLQLGLPPGFRFFPTDEELLVHYLCRKISGLPLSLPIIGDIDLYKFEPWVLPGKAVFGGKEWYFFSPRDRKYPNGTRPNRVAGCGYWKATGTDKVIALGEKRVGIKKALVFYVGKAPKGSKTNWIMHEYRLGDTPSSSSNKKKSITTLRLDEWVLCRIYRKSSGAQQPKPVTFEAPGRSSNNTIAPCTNNSITSGTAYSLLHSLSGGVPITAGNSQHFFGSKVQAPPRQQDLTSIPAPFHNMDSPSDVLGSSTIEEEVDSALLQSGHVQAFYDQKHDDKEGEVAVDEGNHHHQNAIFSRLLQSISGGFDETIGYRL